MLYEMAVCRKHIPMSFYHTYGRKSIRNMAVYDLAIAVFAPRHIDKAKFLL